MKLDINDYKSILEYYNIKYNNKNNTFIIKLAKKMLITKLCRCINKVSNKSKFYKSNKLKSNKLKNRINNLDAISICNSSVMIRKGIKPKKFTCKKNKKFLNSNLEKLKKTLKIETKNIKQKNIKNKKKTKK